MKQPIFLITLILFCTQSIKTTGSSSELGWADLVSKVTATNAGIIHHGNSPKSTCKKSANDSRVVPSQQRLESLADHQLQKMQQENTLITKEKVVLIGKIAELKEENAELVKVFSNYQVRATRYSRKMFHTVRDFKIASKNPCDILKKELKRVNCTLDLVTERLSDAIKERDLLMQYKKSDDLEAQALESIENKFSKLLGKETELKSMQQAILLEQKMLETDKRILAELLPKEERSIKPEEQVVRASSIKVQEPNSFEKFDQIKKQRSLEAKQAEQSLQTIKQLLGIIYSAQYTLIEKFNGNSFNAQALSDEQLEEMTTLFRGNTVQDVVLRRYETDTFQDELWIRNRCKGSAKGFDLQLKADLEAANRAAKITDKALTEK